MASNAARSNDFLFAGLAAVACAALYFFATGLHPACYLTWLAPLPILLLAPRVGSWTAWSAALLAFAAGSLNMAAYYRLVAPVPVVILSVVGPALLFATFVLAFRRFARKGRLLRAAFTLPILWTAYEYLSEIGSPHSTFGNLAYTQMDNLAVLQIASVTGIWSISFLLFLFPSAIAVLTLPLATRHERIQVAVSALAIFAATLIYGELRLHTIPEGPSVTAAVIDADPPHIRYAKGLAAIEVLRAYAARIPALAAQGAQVVVLPEKTVGFDESNQSQIDQLLAQSARDNHLTIAAGFLHLPNLNEIRVYSPDVDLEATYEKHHMLPAFESNLLPGTTRTLLKRSSGPWGLEICKDMDFPALSRQYGNDHIGLVLVPAWDFTQDGWLHGRMAILRGVESGFAIARAPRMGILTLSDSRGRILAQQTTSSSGFTTALASLPIHAETTFYDRFGDWFAWIDLALLILLLVWPFPKPSPLANRAS